MRRSFSVRCERAAMGLYNAGRVEAGERDTGCSRQSLRSASYTRREKMAAMASRSGFEDTARDWRRVYTCGPGAEGVGGGKGACECSARDEIAMASSDNLV